MGSGADLESTAPIGHGAIVDASNKMRIGNDADHSATYIAGIHGATSASGAAVYVNSAGLLGALTSSVRSSKRASPTSGLAVMFSATCGRPHSCTGRRSIRLGSPSTD